jgi:hypothetical protein
MSLLPMENTRRIQDPRKKQKYQMTESSKTNEMISFLN